MSSLMAAAIPAAPSPESLGGGGSGGGDGGGGGWAQGAPAADWRTAVGWQKLDSGSPNWWTEAAVGSGSSCGRRGSATPETLAPSSYGGAGSAVASSESTSPSGSPRSLAAPAYQHPSTAMVGEASPAISRQASSASVAATTVSSGGVEEEVVKYARWLSSRAGHMDGLDQKLAALSKRSAAEFRRVERDQAEHVRRLEALEELFGSRLEQAIREAAAGEATKAAQQVRTQLEERLQFDFKRVSEDMAQLSAEALRKHKQCSEALEGLAHHIDSSSEGVEKWRRDTDTQVKTLLQESKHLEAWRREVAAWKTEAEPKLVAAAKAINKAAEDDEDNATGPSATEAARVEEVCRAGWEGAVRRERKAASERLAASCAELTQHLNELREELLEQRAHVSRCSEELKTGKQEAQKGQKLRDMWLEAQVSELGAALGVQIDEQLQSAGRKREQAAGGPGLATLAAEVKSLQKDLASGVEHLQEFAAKEASRARDVAREEARIVHREVMSLDMRVATLEAVGCSGSLSAGSRLGAASPSPGKHPRSGHGGA